MNSILASLAGPLASDRWKQRVLAPEIVDSGSISRALRVIRGRWPETSDVSAVDEQPIFLFSAGWGSGSTLLQRLIMSDQQTMLWGEPLDHAVPVCRMAQTIVPITDRWPRDHYFSPPDLGAPLEMQWVANLTPPISSLHRAHRAFFRSWLQEPAKRLGRQRWGFKEVRLTVDHARYLQWLFPGARFAFVYRDVLASWRSCQNVKWFSVWPDYRVARASAFAHHWRHVLSGFLEARDELDVFIVRYEDLTQGGVDPSLLADHIGTASLDPAVFDVRVGERSKKSRGISMIDEAVIRAIAGSLRSHVGYLD